MTGEITLRGKVLPVGGIKEKVLAAKSAGITTRDPPRQEREGPRGRLARRPRALKFQFVKEIDQVLDIAFGSALRDRARALAENPSPAEPQAPCFRGGDARRRGAGRGGDTGSNGGVRGGALHTPNDGSTLKLARRSIGFVR